MKAEDMRTAIEKNSPVFFTPGKEEIAGGELAKLARIKGLLRQCKKASIRIIGHTASAGFPLEEKVLSVKRAEKVKAILGDIPNIKYFISGLGATKSNPHPTETEKRLLRKVEVKVLDLST